jgi:transcriptional regulator with XRE-family HTH domain
MSDPLSINGSYLRDCRESLGLSLGEVASRACLSVKQVKQLEEGGASSFYSDNVKLTAARKVAGILGVSEDELLGRTKVQEDAPHTVSPEHSHASTSSILNEATEDLNQEANTVSPPIEVGVAANSALGTASHVYQPIITPGVEALTIRSEALHFLAQPPEEGQDEHHFADSEHEQHSKPTSASESSEAHLAHSTHESNDSMTGASEYDHHSQNDSEHSTTQELTALSSDHSEHPGSSDEAQVVNKDQSTSSSASNLFKIIVLFLLALGIAAFFAQKTNEEHSEPPPPLQVPQEQGNSSADSSPKSDDTTNPSSQTSAGSAAGAGAPSNAASGVSGTNTNTNGNNNTSTANSGANNKQMTPSSSAASSGNIPKAGNPNSSSSSGGGSNTNPSSNPINSNTLSNNPQSTSNNN